MTLLFDRRRQAPRRLLQEPAGVAGCAAEPTPDRPAFRSEAAIFRSQGVSLAAAALVFAALVAWLRIVDRPWICPCGVVALWQGELSQAQNSQQFSDWYSALHVIFGMALFGFVARMAPRWPLAKRAVLAVASSAAWEAMENTPALIAMFSHSPDAPDYFGDSILNATGDTIFVLAGFFAASKLPAWATVLLAIGLDLVVEVAIGDGFVLGTLRLLRIAG
ncbi:DUF2585 family protein [Aurantimonas sp. 22II-16-19i]|uniref:DUF2585 family protein n=1 Tax=Aurantimonas sp. 22II-16-19i TaxID=1317114 RepID=UPI0009F7EBE0|nr:DUF2585 family protein [Aurantimonas sp. 22II-16-19i]ORE99100.1 hypothetical protein ATO4_02000 [Aurantimonas sp. 22II-16-19i]